MPAEIAPLHCRFVRKMITILAEMPNEFEAGPDDSVYQRLVKLEQEAKQGGAAEVSLQVISYVRQTTWSFVVFSAMGLTKGPDPQVYYRAHTPSGAPETVPNRSSSRARLLGLA